MTLLRRIVAQRGVPLSATTTSTSSTRSTAAVAATVVVLSSQRCLSTSPSSPPAASFHHYRSNSLQQWGGCLQFQRRTITFTGPAKKGQAEDGEKKTEASSSSSPADRYSTSSSSAEAAEGTSTPSPSPAADVVAASDEPSSLEETKEPRNYIDPAIKYDDAPMRHTGRWEVHDVVDKERQTIDFRAIDDIESDLMTSDEGRDNALVLAEDEEFWKNKLMFVHKFKKTPKHLTWRELGQEIECIDCVIDMSDSKPEEVFSMQFFFINRRTGERDEIWSATNDVANSEAFTDLMAATGSVLGRADVHRTIRFDDGQGVTRDITIKKKSRYTSDIQLAFRPEVRVNNYEQIAAHSAWEKEMEEAGMPTWGYHPTLMDPEYRDSQDPEGTYHLTMSAHAFSFVLNRAITRLLSRPLKDFYRPSQVVRTMRLKKKEDIGLTHAVKGWLGLDDKVYPHFTPMEAIQEHWLGADAPFSLTAMVNKVREMTYLQAQNPEYQSWLSVRQRDSAIAARNIRCKLLGAGASPLFAPVSHNATMNQLLPKAQRRDLKTQVSIGGMIGMADETRRIEELKQITGLEKIAHDDTDTDKHDLRDRGKKKKVSSEE